MSAAKLLHALDSIEDLAEMGHVCHLLHTVGEDAARPWYFSCTRPATDGRPARTWYARGRTLHEAVDEVFSRVDAGDA